MKNKILTRSICIIFAFCMVLLSFASCKKTTVDTPPKKETPYTPVVSRDEVSDDLETVDMNGFELNLLSYTDAAHGYSLKTMTVKDDSEDLIESAIFRRNSEVENRFNCFINEKQEDRPYDTLRQSAMTGSSDFDVSLMYEEHINRVLIADPTGLSFFEDIPYLNLDKPYWNQDANEAYSINGLQYAGVGDWCLSMYSKVYCYFLNKTLYNTISLDEDIYDLVRDKDWTLEKMFEIAKKYTADTDGVAGQTEGDTFGVVGTSKVHFQLLLTGCGLKFVDKNEQGNYQLAIRSPHASDVMDKILALSSTETYYNNKPEDSNAGISAVEFVENRALLLAATIQNLSGISASTEGHVGVIPAPLYESSQEDYHSIAIGGLLTCFPSTIKEERKNYTGMLVEALCCASYNKVVPTYQNTLLKAQKADSDDDVEMMDLLFSTVTYDLGCSTWANNIRLPLMANIFHPLVTDYSSLLAILSTSVENEITKTVDRVQEIADFREAAKQ